MASEGPNFPGSVTAVGWVNSTNVFVEDDTETSFTWGGGGLSNSLEVRDFGFSIPTGATIDGIEVIIRCRKPGLTDIVVNSVQLLGLTGDDKGDNGHPSTFGFGDRTYGGPADDWNASPTPADINSSNFGAVVLFESAGGGVTVDVDTIKIVVYYTEGAGETPMVQVREIAPHMIDNEDDYVCLPAGSRVTLEPSACLVA